MQTRVVCYTDNKVHVTSLLLFKQTGSAEINIMVRHWTNSDHNCHMSAQTGCWATKMISQSQVLARTPILVELCSMANYSNSIVYSDKLVWTQPQTGLKYIIVRLCFCRVCCCANSLLIQLYSDCQSFTYKTKEKSLLQWCQLSEISKPMMYMYTCMNKNFANLCKYVHISSKYPAWPCLTNYKNDLTCY